MSFNQLQIYIGFAVNITFLLSFILALYQFYLSENAPKLHEKTKQLKAFLKPPNDAG